MRRRRRRSTNCSLELENTACADLLTRMLDKKMELLIDKQPEKLEISGGMQVTGDIADEDTRHRLGLAAGKLVDLLQAHLKQMAEKEDKNE